MFVFLLLKELLQVSEYYQHGNNQATSNKYVACSQIPLLSLYQTEIISFYMTKAITKINSRALKFLEKDIFKYSIIFLTEIGLTVVKLTLVVLLCLRIFELL